MNVLSILKRNPIKTIIYGLFLCWIGFLVILCFFAEFNPVLYDALSQTDVSTEYTIQIPILRYFIEPIIGFSIIFGEQTDGFVILVIIIYIFLRVCFKYIDKKQYRGELEKIPLIREIFAILDFSLKFSLLCAIISSLIMVVGVLITNIMFGYGFYNLILTSGMYAAIAGFCVRLIIGFKRIRENRQIKSYKFGKPAQEIIHFIEIFLIVTVGGVITLGIPWPMQVITINSPTPNEILFDFHSHTFFSDGTLSPVARVQWYIDQGIDGVAVTDHSSLLGAIKAQEFVNATQLNFTVLLGQEYTSEEPAIHLNIYGINTLITPIHLIPPNPFIDFQGPNPMNVSDMIQWVKANKGYVIVNHYLEDIPPPFTLEELRDWGVDGFEIINEGCIYPDEIRQFCLDNDLIVIGGSDYHTNKPLNTFIKLRLDDPNNRSLDAIFSALRRNEHQVITLDQNKQINTDIGIFNEIFKYFLGISPLQIGSWIIWSILGFIGSLKCFRVFIRNISKLSERNKNQ